MFEDIPKFCTQCNVLDHVEERCTEKKHDTDNQEGMRHRWSQANEATIVESDIPARDIVTISTSFTTLKQGPQFLDGPHG